MIKFFEENLNKSTSRKKEWFLKWSHKSSDRAFGWEPLKNEEAREIKKFLMRRDKIIGNKWSLGKVYWKKVEIRSC
jgi:hypothetical protein